MNVKICLTENDAITPGVRNIFRMFHVGTYQYNDADKRLGIISIYTLRNHAKNESEPLRWKVNPDNFRGPEYS